MISRIGIHIPLHKIGTLSLPTSPTQRYTVKAMIIIRFENDTGGSIALAHRLIVTLIGGFGEPCECFGINQKQRLA